MELISQHAKKIMEGCKERARDVGLCFQDETLEYIVTNRDMLELSPKNMIPTLYDYWVQDVEILREKGRYELYPNNPYETVINTRPPISFYNDNNPDWLNVMIFYHVIAHIDFFQNNLYFRHTWDYDFSSRALSDKRMIARLRSEKGRWVDYVIEFARGIDNLVGYYQELGRSLRNKERGPISRLDFYFDIFLQEMLHVSMTEYVKELERYNTLLREKPQDAENSFVESILLRYAEFESLYEKYRKEKQRRKDIDIFQFLLDYSPFLQRQENQWMQMILEAVRATSLYFQPQIRTKILNEGWASYWHEHLFLQDDRISGHEVDFSVINSKVTAMPRVGLNPYALGMRLFYHIEEIASKGKISSEFRRITDKRLRDIFDTQCNAGRDLIFRVRENFSDSMFIQTFIDQDFVDKHKLFVTGKRFNKERMSWQYYVKSRDAEQYRDMVLDSLYHPPSIRIDTGPGNALMLNHLFEGKPLVKDFLQGTLLGIEYLWGGPVYLDTSEALYRAVDSAAASFAPQQERPRRELHWKRMRYCMKDRTLSRKEIDS